MTRTRLLVGSVLAVGLVCGAGGATAGALVTGAQIKNGSVTGKDVKNRSLKVKDLNPKAVAALRGQAGADGAPGASAFAPPPSGVVLTGGGIASGIVDSENDTVYGFTQLPVSLSAPLDDAAPGRSLYAAPDDLFPAAAESASRCAGSFTTPTATPGTLCVYVADATNVIPGSAGVKAGSGFLADGAESSAFYVSALSDAAGATLVRYVWTYTAP